MFFDIVKFYWNKLFSPKYIIKGKCKMCGQCCRMITFSENGKPVESVEEFEELQKKYKQYRHFYYTGKKDNGELLFACKSLSNDNKCKDYFFRSLYCRKYPDIDKKFIMAGGKLLDGCGYRIEPTKKFSDYIKNNFS